MKKTTILIAVLLAGCATQQPTATMKVVAEIRPIQQVGVSGDKIVQVTALQSNVWNVQQWKHNGKTLTFKWPVFHSEIVSAETNVLGNMPQAVTNYVDRWHTNTVTVTNPPNATLELLPEEKVLRVHEAGPEK